MGVIEACKEKGVYAIGVDSNQDDVVKGTVLTSVIKNLDIAVFDTVKQCIENKFTGGVFVYGLKDNGVSLTDFKYTKDKIPAEYLERLEIIKKDIIDGKIVIEID